MISLSTSSDSLSSSGSSSLSSFWSFSLKISDNVFKVDFNNNDYRFANHIYKKSEEYIFIHPHLVVFLRMQEKFIEEVRS